MNWNNILERAGWTFLQGFLVVITAAPSLDLSVAKTAALAGAMAALSFVKTVVQQRLEG